MGNIRATLKWWLHRALDIRFDTLHGVDTSAVISPTLPHADSLHRDAGPFYGYDPSPWRILTRCLDLAGLSTCREFVFVDIGCGKGKVLLSAMTMPFDKIIGVEFSPYLCEIARRNVKSVRLLRRRCTNVEIACCDAADWPPPADAPLICFFANPFDSRIMKKVLSNIVVCHNKEGHPVYLIFYRMSSRLTEIGRMLLEATNGAAVNVASTAIGRASVNIYQLSAR